MKEKTVLLTLRSANEHAMDFGRASFIDGIQLTCLLWGVAIIITALAVAVVTESIQGLLANLALLWIPVVIAFVAGSRRGDEYRTVRITTEELYDLHAMGIDDSHIQDMLCHLDRGMYGDRSLRMTGDLLERLRDTRRSPSKPA